MDDKPVSNTPKFLSYTVDTSSKKVDFVFEANTPNELTTAKEIIGNNKNLAFIETYLFEDTTYTQSSLCKTSVSKQASKCTLVCPENKPVCSADVKYCQAMTTRGCRYIIRAYYDEMYTSATIAPVSQKEKQACVLTCTHKVVAKYNQLFEKVDINRVAACVKDTSTGKTACPVEVRAEFGANAKFYLINATGGTQ
jgi:hypothetical protein